MYRVIGFMTFAFTLSAAMPADSGHAAATRPGVAARAQIQAVPFPQDLGWG